jgi:hypothetical protein
VYQWWAKSNRDLIWNRDFDPFQIICDLIWFECVCRQNDLNVNDLNVFVDKMIWMWTIWMCLSTKWFECERFECKYWWFDLKFKIILKSFLNFKVVKFKIEYHNFYYYKIFPIFFQNNFPEIIFTLFFLINNVSLFIIIGGEK